eukprot:1629014-Pleurochrysis_carterae.AAC.1
MAVTGAVMAVVLAVVMVVLTVIVMVVLTVVVMVEAGGTRAVRLVLGECEANEDAGFSPTHRHLARSCVNR